MKARGVLRRFLDPATWFHVVKLINFHAYSHVEERRRMTVGAGVHMSPTVSLRNGERIAIGDGVHVGERSCLWAGNRTGRITVGDQALLGPEVYVTASNYGTEWGTAVMDQATIEDDVAIGAGAWLGVRATVVAGVTIGEGAVLAAGAVATRDIPAGAIAAGVPARVVGWRKGFPGALSSPPDSAAVPARP